MDSSRFAVRPRWSQPWRSICGVNLEANPQAVKVTGAAPDRIPRASAQGGGESVNSGARTATLRRRNPDHDDRD
tara:strand:+ start:889 stop:1110 length:222 start_codon:yes stop_codon:yes gene_type:complete